MINLNYILIGCFCSLFLANCSDNSKDEEVAKESDAISSPDSISESSTKDPKKDKSVVNNFSSLESAILSNKNYVWQVNKTIQAIKSAEDAKAAESKLNELVVLSKQIKEGRAKFPELANEATIDKSYQMKLAGLAIARQSLNGTIRAKKKSGVHDSIEPYLQQILENTPNPYGLIEPGE